MARRHLVTSSAGREIGAGWAGSAHASWSTVAGRWHARQRRGLVDGQTVPCAPAHATARALRPLWFFQLRQGAPGGGSLPISPPPGSRGRLRMFATRSRPTPLRLSPAGLTRGCGGGTVTSEPSCGLSVVSRNEPRIGGLAPRPAAVRPARVPLPARGHRSSSGRPPVEWLPEGAWLCLLDEPGRRTRGAKAAADWAVQSWLPKRSQHPCRDPRLRESSPPPGVSILTRRPVRDRHRLRVPSPPERGL